MPDIDLTPTQGRAAQAIVNLFETGQVLGDYGQVTILAKDTGHLTYGRAQTTLGSGNLAGLVQRYADNHAARFGQRLAEWLPRLRDRDVALDGETRLHNLLRACADDPVMRETQDAFFDEVYWRPALRDASTIGLRSALAAAVVYDSHVHGSWAAMRDETTAKVGSPQVAGEQVWVQAYVRQRRDWLANHPNDLLHATVYRMDAFQRLIDQSLWGLALPLVVRNAEISPVTLNGLPPGSYDGPTPGARALALQQPLARGLDVRLLQLALSDQGADIKADGIFGQGSQTGVKNYQLAQGLPANGVADIALIARLVS